MEMEMEASAAFSAEATETTMLDRLQSAAEALEQAADRLAAVELEATATRESDLAARLAEAESTITNLRAAAGRKTLGTLQAKEGATMEAGALDTALSTLSLEQRIAVKAQLLRSGLLG